MKSNKAPQIWTEVDYFLCLSLTHTHRVCDTVCRVQTLSLIIKPPKWTLRGAGQPQARSVRAAAAARYVHSLSHVLARSHTHMLITALVM